MTQPQNPQDFLFFTHNCERLLWQGERLCAYFVFKKSKMESTTQLMKLAEPQMLKLWKLIMHLQPMHRDCTIEREDGVDVDSLLLLEMGCWYAHLLETAPVEWLPVDDVKGMCRLAMSDNGVVTATMPWHCVRPVEWKLKGWKRSVTTFLQPDAPAALAQFNEWTQGGCHCPAIINNGATMQLFSTPKNSSPSLELARCIVKPLDGSYVFSPAALHTISHWNKTPPALR